MADNLDIQMFIHESYEFKPETTIYSGNRVDHPISQTKPILDVYIQKTVTMSSPDPSDPREETTNVRRHISMPIRFANLSTINGCRDELSRHHAVVTSHVLDKQEFWNRFIEQASDIVRRAALNALSYKPEVMMIVIKIEVRQNVIVGGIDELLRVVQESMEDTGDDVVPAAVAALETRKFDRKESQEVCAICLDEYSMGVNVTRMPCSHDFHQDCIVAWLKTKHTCPMCRSKLPVSQA